MMKDYRRGLLILLALTVFLTSQIIISVCFAQENFITAKDATKHIGEEQTVCGMVASTKFSTQSKRQPTFLNLDQPYPNQIFTIVIWGADRAKFPQPPEHFYKRKKVCVRGTIQEYRGKPEIIVNDPSQITMAPSQ
jgi:DNA/RNA endonuclease YhcR with UshA esterase domain